MDSDKSNISFEVRDVSYRYDEVTAINGLSMSIERGRRVAILGANGSGKSTLLRLLDGLCLPDVGIISFAGNDLTAESLRDERFSFAFRRQVGLVFQNPDVQLFNPTVFDEVAFGPLQLRWPRDEITYRVNETLQLLGLDHLKERQPHRLSGGEKKRVALASVLVLDPQVLLLDEPTSSLDPRSRSQLIDIMIGWKDNGKTVITATHELDIIEDLADYAYVLENGGVAASGPIAEVLDDQEMLRRTNLLHAHRHRHASGLVHSHPHTHHEHKH
jgi:cobalt/nickel transport system ATP-binding protein